MKVMTRINPFCDSDFRHSLQFLAGVYVMLGCASIIVDLLVIAEVSHFYIYWSHEELQLSPASADLVLIVDIFVIALQLFYSLQLFNAVSENAYSKIRRWIFPSVFLLGIRVVVFIFYMYAMPVSPYYLYFTTITIFYSVFLEWPVHHFLKEFETIPSTENSRLLRCVN